MEKIVNQIQENRNLIQISVKNNISFEDFLKKQLNFKVEEKYLHLWKYAFENASDWKEVEEFFALVNVKIKNNSFDSSISYESIEEAQIIIEIYTKIAEDEFLENSFYHSVFRELVYLKCKDGIYSPQEINMYNIIPTLNITDMYGQWEKDLLFGHLNIFLKTEYKFPTAWKTSKEAIQKFQLEYIINYSQDDKLNDDSSLKSQHLQKFVEVFLAKHQKIEFKKVLLDQLGRMFINSISNLMTLPSHAWETIEKNLGPIITPLLKKEIEEKCGAKKKKTAKRTHAEMLSDLHKAKRYLLYESKIVNEKTQKYIIDEIGYLNLESLEKGYKEQANDKNFDGGHVFKDIISHLKSFTSPNLPFVKPSHGMILKLNTYKLFNFLGKTCLCNITCKKAGLELVAEPLSSSEVNRSKVGETEQLLMALFRRAESLPHLLCCIAIDEIDALTPKRNEKSAEYKIDVLSLLLSLIGGIKDIPNMFVIASTNRLNKMDEAICRRLQNKFFVGRLDPEKRLKIILEITELEFPFENIRKLDFDQNQYELIKKLTTNFSGAALESFRSRIVSYLYEFYDNALEDETLICIADNVAKDFQIFLGKNTIPLLLTSDFTNTIKFELSDKVNYTGKIVFDMSDKNCCVMQLEYKENNSYERNVEEYEIRGAELTHDILPILVYLSIKENVDFIQMFDTTMLLNNAAFDDNTVMECILEKIGEWEQYPRSMAIFDVDSLIGVTENISDSSLGQSSSYSITNNKLWHQVVIQTANSKLEDSTGKNHKWVVVITKIDYISKQFKSLTRFPLTKTEKENFQNNTKERICKNCEIGYTESKNNIDSCNYHDGPLIDLRANKDEIVELDKKNLHCNFIDSNLEERQDMLKNFVYLCCFQQFNCNGCKKAYHSDTIDNRNYNKYKEYYETI